MALFFFKISVCQTFEKMQKKETTSLQLKDVNAFVLTIDSKKALHAQNILTGHFKRVYCIHGVRSVFGKPENLIAGALGHIKMIQSALQLCHGSAFRPFLILEDDVSWTKEGKSVVLEIPNDADAMFLGISRCGMDVKIKKWTPKQTLLVQKDDLKKNCLRVFNMLSTHAILVNSMEFALSYIVALTEFCAEKRRTPDMHGWDCFTSQLSLTHNVYALKDPIFYQCRSLGGREEETKILLSNCNLKEVSPQEISSLQLSNQNFFGALKTFSGFGYVYIDLKGGLGNQMFQIAAAYAYARRTGRILRLDGNQRHSSGISDRSTYWSSVFSSFCSQYDVFVHQGHANSIFGNSQPKKLKEPHFHFEKQLPASMENSDIELSGYFQSLQYFDSEASSIAKMFAEPSSRCVSSTANEWWKTCGLEQKNTISVHIRRGDYVQLCDTHRLLSSEYYSKAIAAIQNQCSSEKRENLTFVVFSDDVAEARTVMDSIDVDYILAPSALDDVGSFYLMIRASQCGSIIANSSYSWWSAFVAWQSNSRSLPVIMPRQWFGPNGPKNHSLHIDSWICV